MASDATQPLLIPRLLWARLVFSLRRRGDGRRESGAFLFAPENSSLRRITAFSCYDNFDPCAYQSGAITFHAEGYASLWEHCRRKELQILADVHSHPGSWVGQSGIDQENPMIPTHGHTALIVPNFGRTPWWSLERVGVYEYLGDFKWRDCRIASASPRVALSIW